MTPNESEERKMPIDHKSSYRNSPTLFYDIMDKISEQLIPEGSFRSRAMLGCGDKGATC